MLVAARRARFRRVLDGEETVILPTVYDAVSARIVEMAGFPFRVAVQAMHEATVHLKAHGDPGPYDERMCSPGLLETLTRTEQYAADQKRFLR